MARDEQEALDTVGEILMTRVRDKAISEWDRIIAGEMKDESSRRICADLKACGADATSQVARLVPAVVDSVLHHLLWTLEQERRFDLVAHLRSGAVANLRDVSDGLPGELYSDDGWIARFSRQRRGDIL